MKPVKFLKKLYLPLYIYFVISLIIPFFIMRGFEEYTKYDFTKISGFLEENRKSINLRINMLMLQNLLNRLENVYKGESDTNSIEEIKEMIVSYSLENINYEDLEKENFLKNKSNIVAQIRQKSKVEFENETKDAPESSKPKFGRIKLDVGDRSTGQIELSGSRINSIIKNLFILPRDNKETLIRREYKLYRLHLFMYLSIIILTIYLFPVYKYKFKKKNYNMKVEQKIVNLPFFIFILSWLNSLYFLFIRYIFFYIENALTFRNALVYFFSAVLFGSMATFINCGITTSYIYNKIACGIFSKNNKYKIKNGYSISLSKRIALIIFSLGIVPLFINIFISFYFHFGRIAPLINAHKIDFIALFYIFFPMITIFTAGIIFFIPQILSMLRVKKNIQQPLSRLVEHMNKVSEGDFSTRASVLSADEIGKLRGHFNNMVAGLNEREKIRDTFGKFVSVEIAKKLMETGKVKLEGEELDTTIMFTDIRNFTPLSESMSPDKLIKFLNDYFGYMVKPVLKEKGVINKFIGDSIMAIFSPNFGLDNHVDGALKSALGLRKALSKFNKLEKYPVISQGIGLHTGSLIAGNVGTTERMEYTVIGDVVNIASRIESQNKEFDTDIL
ncbi:MAG: adenylate/guanylate cyclase domain-containing protein, partial [Candidatus Muiribacteriota bacterium]